MRAEEEHSFAVKIHIGFTVIALARRLCRNVSERQRGSQRYFVARIPPTTLVITSLPSRSSHFFATASIFPIKASYSSLPLNMDVHSFRSSLNEARTYSMKGATSGKVR